MPLPTDLMGGGMPPLLAGMLGNEPEALAGAGTTQATAAAIKSHITRVTASGGATGAILPSAAKVGTPYFISAVGATAPVIYCPVGHTLNGTTNGGATFSASPGMLIFLQTAKGVWSVTGTATASVA